jgi:hypothetical protein
MLGHHTHRIASLAKEHREKRVTGSKMASINDVSEILVDCDYTAATRTVGHLDYRPAALVSCSRSWACQPVIVWFPFLAQPFKSMVTTQVLVCCSLVAGVCVPSLEDCLPGLNQLGCKSRLGSIGELGVRTGGRFVWVN